jgi:8-oxo-dGTP pyrophosphatase MutT (NUDIX family)
VSYLEKVRRCNARNLASYVPFLIENTQVGWLTQERAHTVLQHPEVFIKTAKGVSMSSSLSTADARSKALAGAVPNLVASGLFRAGTGEMYGVRNEWSAPASLLMDRMHVPSFGVCAYGVHLNGFVTKADGVYLWIGTRASDRIVEPGKLDNMVAGGQPANLSIDENLVKEAREEAGLPAELARTARAASAISYCFETPNGLRNDTLFCYDLEMPANIIPRNTDGEISGFELMSLRDALGLVRETDRFKFNVNLVIIDFAMRVGALTPEKTPEFEKIAAELRQRPQPVV